MNVFRSDLTGRTYPASQMIRIESIRPSILEMMQKDHPDAVIQRIGIQELDQYRQRYIEESLRAEMDTFSSIEKEVLEKLHNHELISGSIEKDPSESYTFGQKVADKVASFGGSWKFIIIFCCFIGVWITINIVALFPKHYDPYPFILLNLMLSCLAALQAPVIMMSQNRSEEKDRQRAIDDYKVNLKSEIEIQTLHEKVDHLILNQQARMFEIQNIQTEMLKDILGELKPKRH